MVPMLIGQPSTLRMDSIMPRYELRHMSTSATTIWRSHRLVTWTWSSAVSFAGTEVSSRVWRALFACW
jgi:hypothetical protein